LLLFFILVSKASDFQLKIGRFLFVEEEEEEEEELARRSIGTTSST
jgi:hypothetical protein